MSYYNRVATYVGITENRYLQTQKKQKTYSASQAHECLSDSALHDDAMIDDNRIIFMSFMMLVDVNIMLAEPVQ